MTDYRYRSPIDLDPSILVLRAEKQRNVHDAIATASAKSMGNARDVGDDFLAYRTMKHLKP